MNRVVFYDTTFYLTIIAFAVGYNLYFRAGYTSGIYLLPFVIVFFGAVIFFWGMLIHQYRRKDWGWFVGTLVPALFFGIGFITGIIYYFVKMRKIFQKHDGKKIDYGMKHKSVWSKDIWKTEEERKGGN